jgi:GR25 family glycosyltransferase involved in LPS biosynthesis
MIWGKTRLGGGGNGRGPTSAAASAARIGIITALFYSRKRHRRHSKSTAFAWARSSWHVALCAGFGLVLVFALRLSARTTSSSFSSSSSSSSSSSTPTDDPLGGVVVAAVLVINLARRTDRWHRISQHLGTHHDQRLHSLKIERIEAVDGHNTSQVDFAQMVVDGNLRQRAFESVMHKGRRVWGQDMTAGACGCFLSHIKAWERALQLEASVLVLEDDVELVLSLFERLFPRALQDLPQNFGLLYLGDMAKDTLTIHKTRYSATLDRLSRPLWGTYAYVVSPRAARRLLFHAYPIDVQVDSYIKQVAELYEENMPNFVVAKDVVYTDNSESRDTDAQQKYVVAKHGERDAGRERQKKRPRRYHVLSSQASAPTTLLKFDPPNATPQAVMYHDVGEATTRFAPVLKSYTDVLDHDLSSSGDLAHRAQLQRWLLCLLVAAHHGGGLCFTEPFVVLRSIDHLLQDVQVGVFTASSSSSSRSRGVVVGESASPPPTPIAKSPSQGMEPLLSVVYAASSSPARIAVRAALSSIARLMMMKTTTNSSSARRHWAQTMASGNQFHDDASSTVAIFPPHFFDPLVPLQRPCRCQRGWAAVAASSAVAQEYEEDSHELEACQSRCDRRVAPPYAAGYRVFHGSTTGVGNPSASSPVRTLHVVMWPSSTKKTTTRQRLNNNLERWRRLHPWPTWRIVVHDGIDDHHHDYYPPVLKASRNCSRAGQRHPTSTNIITSLVSACVGLDAVEKYGGVYVDLDQAAPRRALVPGLLSQSWSQQVVDGRRGGGAPAVALSKTRANEKQEFLRPDVLGFNTVETKQHLSSSFFAAPAPNHPVIRRLSVACWRAVNLLLKDDRDAEMMAQSDVAAALLEMQQAIMDDAWSVRFYVESDVFFYTE